MDEDARVCLKDIRVLVDDLQKSVSSAPLHSLSRQAEWDALLAKVTWHIHKHTHTNNIQTHPNPLRKFSLSFSPSHSFSLFSLCVSCVASSVRRHCQSDRKTPRQSEGMAWQLRRLPTRSSGGFLSLTLSLDSYGFLLLLLLLSSSGGRSQHCSWVAQNTTNCWSRGWGEENTWRHLHEGFSLSLSLSLSLSHHHHHLLLLLLLSLV